MWFGLLGSIVYSKTLTNQVTRFRENQINEIYLYLKKNKHNLEIININK